MHEPVCKLSSTGELVPYSKLLLHVLRAKAAGEVEFINTPHSWRNPQVRQLIAQALLAERLGCP